MKRFFSLVAYWLPFLIVMLVSLTLFTDAFGSATSSIKFIGFSASLLVLPSLFLLGFLNFKYKLSFQDWFNKLLLYFLIPLGAFATISLTLIDFHTPLNYVFSLTHLHQEQLGLITFFWILAVLVSKKVSWWKKNHILVIEATPFFLFAALYLVSLWPFNYFLEFVKEDHPIEYAQFFVLLFGAFYMFYLSVRLYKKKNYWFILSLLVGLGFLFLAGDEISWGQRLIGLQTPEALVEKNRQGETTVHNLYAVEWLVGWMYSSLALLGVFGRYLAQIFFKRFPKFVNLFAPKYLVGYFVFPMVFFSFHMMSGSWSEPMELFLYAGVVLWSISALKELTLQ